MRAKTFLVLVMALVLAGCGGRQTEELLGSAVVTASIDQISGNHAIFVATTRKRAGSTCG